MSGHSCFKTHRLRKDDLVTLCRQTRPYLTPISQAQRRTSHIAGVTRNAGGPAESQITLAESLSQPSNKRPLQDLKTGYLIRSLILGQCFSSPQLLKTTLGIMKWVVSSKMSFINPDRNPVIGTIMRRLIYDQFCAGETPAEVRSKVAEIKSAGFSGVILGFSREIVMDDVEGTHGVGSVAKAEQKCIDEWLQANIDTLNLIGPGDYMNIKFTGAGPTVGEALLKGHGPPEAFARALEVICKQAKSQGKRVWVDAEQQAFQNTIDDWTIELMRRHNREQEAVVYNTIQAYLIASRSNILRHLQLASSEGWICGIKLVRGAYILSDIRSRIWSTKVETDENYNSIVHDVLSRSFGSIRKEFFPRVDLFIAGHNKESIQRACKLVGRLVTEGEQPRPVAYGQLQGMADDVSFDLVQTRKTLTDITGLSPEQASIHMRTAPRPYKCLNWGTVGDCMHFLMRRAVENGTALDRLRDGLVEVKSELRARFLWASHGKK